MNWTVDTPRQIGDLTFAAIVQTDVGFDTTGIALGGAARKQPLLLLSLGHGQATAVDLNGHSYAADEIETLYPTAISQILTRLKQVG